MQRPCLSGTTKKAGFVARNKFAAKTSDTGEGTIVVPVRPSTKYNVSADAFSNNAFNPLLNLRPSQLVRYTIILLSEKAEWLKKGLRGCRVSSSPSWNQRSPLPSLSKASAWALLAIRFPLLISGRAFSSHNDHPIDFVAIVETYHRVTVVKLVPPSSLSAYQVCPTPLNPAMILSSTGSVNVIQSSVRAMSCRLVFRTRP